MPCWTVRETTVELNAGDLTLLAEALKAEGATNVRVSGETVTFTDQQGNRGYYRKGEGLTVQQDSQFARDPNPLKRAYSREVVQSQCKKFGWKATWAGADQAVAVKRRF